MFGLRRVALKPSVSKGKPSCYFSNFFVQFESARSELSSESFQSCEENESDREGFPEERPFSLHTPLSVM